jgi:hypothetical protein
MDNARGSVAPTTNPSLGGGGGEEIVEDGDSTSALFDHSLAKRAICSKSIPPLTPPPRKGSVSMSFDPGFDVLHRTKAPRSEYFPIVFLFVARFGGEEW